MIIMALDHCRDFLSRAAMSFLPTDLTQTTAALFFTRWITHFCAPVFAFTTGIGASLWLGKSRTTAQLSKFLVSRGLWFVFLELTLLRFLLFFEYHYARTVLILGVIWMLGLCMVVLAFAVHIPVRLLTVFSILVIVTHNLFDGVQSAKFGRLAWLWDILHQPAAFPVGSLIVVTAYPLVPWIAVVALGYCFGPVFRWGPAKRQSFLVKLGAALTVAFLLLRSWNHYGDRFAWSAQRSSLFTVLSFLNTTKYPPSFDFLLMTLGPALMLLAFLERVTLSPKNPAVVFGRVPFFYFVLHFAVFHLVTVVMNSIRYGFSKLALMPPPSMGGPRDQFPSDFGYPLWFVYLAWLAVLIALYPVCLWFANLKQRRRDWWLSYI
jgi:uncharacterized membrane protein